MAHGAAQPAARWRVFGRVPGPIAERTAFGPATLIGCAWWLAFVLWQLAGWGGDAHRNMISDLAPLPIEAIAVVLAARAARKSDISRRARSAWMFVAFAFGAYLLGDLIWAWFEVVRDVSPFPSIADGAYLAFYPLLLAGLLRFPVSARTRAENIRLALDVGIVVLGGAMAVWYFVIGPTVRDASAFDLATLLSIAYPVGDLVLILGVALVLLRGVPRTAGWPLRILLGGLTAFVIADVGFGHLSLVDGYTSGDWPDTFWMLADLSFVAAAEFQFRAKPSSEAGRSAASSTLRVSALPYLAIAGSYGLLLSVSRSTAQFPLDGLLLGAFALTSVVVARQLTALKDNVRLVEEFRRLASTDALTGLVSRRHFHDVAQQELVVARHEQRNLSVVMIDVDHFKIINDTFGHGIGDDALRWVANRIQAMMPPEAIAARYGGDELVVLAPTASIDEALAFSQLLVDHVGAAHRPVAGGPDRISISVGAAEAAGCADVETLLRCADAALYEAKRAGRGCARAHPQLVEDPGPVAVVGSSLH